MAIKRLLDQARQKTELADEISLRPRSFAEYVGQNHLKENLKVAIAAAQKRGEPLDHILLYGPAGLGKTTMAHVIANQMQSHLRASSGPSIPTPATLASLITNLQSGDILFIDEIHRLSQPVEETLYSVMEDFKLEIVLGKGAGAKNLQLDLPRFTLLAATTKAGSLSSPLRGRFGHLYRLEFYTVSEIAQIVERSAQILKTQITSQAALILAQRARLTPRIANRLLRRVRDYTDIKADGLITEKQVKAALEMLAIDHLGLDVADRSLLRTILERHHGGPVGLNTLAAILGDEPQTIEDYFEPFLLQIGLLERTNRGRCLTAKAREHLKMH